MSLIAELLNLASPPVAIAFVKTAPAGVPHVAALEPAGCGYWRRAAGGEVFYTVADDHKRCPVGAHTHNVPLSPAEKDELMGLVQTMVGLEYIKMDEVSQIATRKTPLEVVVYAPLDAAPVAPDVVLVRGNARQLMLLAEAAQKAEVAGAGPAMGRPTCAVIPEAINTARTSASFGCIGNRVYTGIADDQFYTVISGSDLNAVIGELDTIVSANATLAEYHQGRRATLATM